MPNNCQVCKPSTFCKDLTQNLKSLILYVKKKKIIFGSEGEELGGSEIRKLQKENKSRNTTKIMWSYN